MLSFLRTAHSVELEESELEDEDDELLPLLSEPFSPLLAGADAPPLTDAGLSAAAAAGRLTALDVSRCPHIGDEGLRHGLRLCAGMRVCQAFPSFAVYFD